MIACEMFRCAWFKVLTVFGDGDVQMYINYGLLYM